MSKPALLDALETIKNAVGVAVAVAAIPNKVQVFAGQPIGPELTKILAQNDAEAVVTVMPMPGAQNTARYERKFFQTSAPNTALSAQISPLNVITFAGTVAQNLAEDVAIGGEDATGGEDVAIGGFYNVHTLLAGYPAYDAYVQATPSMSMAGLATAVAAAITALGLSGVTASASGQQVTVIGANVKYCNVGSAGTIAREISRVMRRIQVSVYSSDPFTRFAVGDAIYQSIGDAISLFLTLNNGSQLYCRYASDALDETSQNEYTLYVHHFIFDCEYGIIQTATATQIGAVTLGDTIANFQPQTAIFGGTT